MFVFQTQSQTYNQLKVFQQTLQQSWRQKARSEVKEMRWKI